MVVFRKPVAAGNGVALGGGAAAASAAAARLLWRPFADLDGEPDGSSSDGGGGDGPGGVPATTTAMMPCEACQPARALATPPDLDLRQLPVHTTRKAVPTVPLAARGRVLGTVWCLNATDPAGLHRLATAQMVRAPPPPTRALAPSLRATFVGAGHSSSGSPMPKPALRTWSGARPLPSRRRWRRRRWPMISDWTWTPAPRTWRRRRTRTTTRPRRRLPPPWQTRGTRRERAHTAARTGTCALMLRGPGALFGSARRAESDYERERNNRIRENNRLLQSLGLLATDFSVAAATDALPVLGDLLGSSALGAPDPAAPIMAATAAAAAAAAAGRPLAKLRLSFATVPPIADLRVDDLPAYRTTVVAVALELAERLRLGGCGLTD